MKRTRLSRIPFSVPAELFPLVSEAPIFDSSCSSMARVCFIDKDGGYYLKKAPHNTLKREAEVTAYFHRKGLGTEVLFYGTEEDSDFLLTRAVRGDDLTHEKYLSDPCRLCDKFALALRQLHDCGFSDCPVKDRMTEYCALVEENYAKGHFDLSLFPEGSPYAFASFDDAYRAFCAGRGMLTSDTLLHGDFCLPNVIFDEWRFSAFIDLGNGGVGDRHVDLFWGAWTLFYNLKTDKYRDRFFDAYGRDRVDEDRLLTVAAAEIFG